MKIFQYCLTVLKIYHLSKFLPFSVSTQNPTETQEVVAHALGIPMNKVVCRVKRMGGGFGGKESRNIPISLVIIVVLIALLLSISPIVIYHIHQLIVFIYSKVVAVAAAKVNKPVRLMLDRDDDMVVTGTRYFVCLFLLCDKSYAIPKLSR